MHDEHRYDQWGECLIFWYILRMAIKWVYFWHSGRLDDLLANKFILLLG